MPKINNSSIHFAILAKQMENMVKLVFSLLLAFIVLIRSAGSYNFGKIPIGTENPIKDKEFTDCCKLKHGMTQL